MPDLGDLARQAAFVFAFAMLPSTLFGTFPFWLALRRRRPLFGVAALMTCAAAGWASIVAVGQRTYEPFALVLIGAVGGLLVATMWSAALLRRAA